MDLSGFYNYRMSTLQFFVTVSWVTGSLTSVLYKTVAAIDKYLTFGGADYGSVFRT